MIGLAYKFILNKEYLNLFQTFEIQFEEMDFIIENKSKTNNVALKKAPLKKISVFKHFEIYSVASFLSTIEFLQNSPIPLGPSSTTPHPTEVVRL